jgi:hypothetical protein
MNYRIETKEKIHDSERNEMQVENKSAQTHNLNAVKMLDSPISGCRFRYMTPKTEF